MPALESDFILVEVAAGVARLCLNRPQAMNALCDPLVDELMERLEEYSADPAIRAIVITGAGRGFCAGGDVKRLGNVDERTVHQKLAHLQHLHRLPLALAMCPKVTIAMINGPAMGAGLGIAVACDFRIAARSARFGAAFVRVGMSTDFGVSWQLPRIVGSQHARELLLTGDVIDAESALAIGLVSMVVDDQELAKATETFAARFASGPTLAYGHIKRNLAVSSNASLAEMLDIEALTQITAVTSDDHRDAIQAFVDKRTPRFEGR